jgi:geranylgeranyl reductase
MPISTDILIIGAGPGGLACAKKLAENGIKVLVLERKKTIGPKVCAGGITWSGLLRHVPEDLLEGAFRKQYIFSNLQRICVSEPEPIVATINRETLGKWMAAAAVKAGAEISTGVTVLKISREKVSVRDSQGNHSEIRYKQLVGADGSNSMVRKFLGISTSKMGAGINYQIKGECSKMEWHLNTKMFGSGYGWIFPHRKTISIGAYCDRTNLPTSVLKKRLLKWAQKQGYDLGQEQPQAALVNHDYQGFCFENKKSWLVGDAAGLASGLTGEGIYPAIVSGEAVARKIINPAYPADEIAAMVKKQKKHHTVIRLSAKSPFINSLLMEWLIVLLRFKVIDFHTLEMGEQTAQKPHPCIRALLPRKKA